MRTVIHPQHHRYNNNTTIGDSKLGPVMNGTTTNPNKVRTEVLELDSWLLDRCLVEEIIKGHPGRVTLFLYTVERKSRLPFRCDHDLPFVMRVLCRQSVELMDFCV